MADNDLDDRLEPDDITPEHHIMSAMVSLSIVFLILIAAILPQATPTMNETAQNNVIHLYLVSLFTLWALFPLELIAQLLLLRSSKSRRWTPLVFAVALVPPLRILIPPSSTPEHLWIPLLGWRRPTKTLRKEIEGHFSAPMIVVALMILPMLALEFIWTKQLESRPWLWTTIDIGTRIIWLAFAVEFLIMVSISKKRAAYCIKHWVDIAIIILPLISFLRILRLMRLGGLAKLHKVSRVYRLRGLALRALRALMILRILESASHRFAHKHLDHLKSKVHLKHEEIEELHVEIAELEEHITKSQKKRETRATEKAASKIVD